MCVSTSPCLLSEEDGQEATIKPSSSLTRCCHCLAFQFEKEEGARLGVKSTPTFLFGHRLRAGEVRIVARLRGAASYDLFRKGIDLAVSAAKARSHEDRNPGCALWDMVRAMLVRSPGARPLPDQNPRPGQACSPAMPSASPRT